MSPYAVAGKELVDREPDRLDLAHI